MKKIIKFSTFLFVLILGMSIVAADGNFTDLQSEISLAGNDNELILSQNYTFNSSSDTGLSSGVVISNNNFTLDGNGSTINGNNVARIFQITGENVTLKNLNLINGNAGADIGGAIVVSGTNIVLMDNNISNSFAGHGGAIAADAGASVSIIGKNIISHNSASGHGGAIDSWGSDFVLLNGSNIIVNNSAVEGGGISHDSGMFNITGSNIIANNTASNTGGGIFNWNPFGMNIEGSNVISGNTALSGGGIYSGNPTFLSINGNNIIANNTAINGGGGIVNMGSGTNLLIINGSNIIANNTANSTIGGGVYNLQGVTIINGSNIITNNFAMNIGGGLFNSVGTFTIIGSNFITYNHAADAGGALGNDENMNIIGSNNISYNYATFAGAIGNVGKLNISGPNIFSNNYATIAVGGILNDVGMTIWQPTSSTGNLSLSETIFINNTSPMGNDIFNGAFMSLNKVSFDFVAVNAIPNIYSNGTITSKTKFVILTNQTQYVNINEPYNVSAILVDDSDNIIGGYNFNFTINGTNFTSNVLPQGIYIVEYTPTQFGILPVTATFEGPGNLTNLVFYNSILVVRSNPDLNVNTTTGIFNATFNVTVNSNATGKIRILNGTTVLGEYNITNGQKYITLNLGAGDYNLTVEFITNTTEFNNASTISSFTIDKQNPVLDVSVPDVNFGENATVYVNLTGVNGEGLDGIVSVVINGNTYNVTVSNGIGNRTIGLLAGGNYLINASFEGNDNYTSALNDTVSFNVIPITAVLNITVDDVTVGENATVYVNLTKGLNGTVTVVINGKTYTIDVINGVGNKIIDQLPAGTYTVNGTFGDGVNFTKVNDITSFDVNKIDVILNASNIEMFYLDGTKYLVILKDINGNLLVNYTIQITINGRSYNKTTDINGSTTLNLNLAPKNYTITSFFNGTDKYNNYTIVTNVTILPTLIGSDIVKHYLNATQYHVTLLDTNGNPLNNTNVTFNINGVFYNRTSNDKGVVTLNINLFPGNYTITAIGPDGLMISNNILVLTTLIGEDLTKKFSDAATYNVKVLDGLGNPLSGQTVTINIHGMIYQKVSDSNGIAKLNINLNPGSYIATATWNGYSTSNNVTVEI